MPKNLPGKEGAELVLAAAAAPPINNAENNSQAARSNMQQAFFHSQLLLHVRVLQYFAVPPYIAALCY